MSTLVGGMCSIRCHMELVLAFMHLDSILNLRLLLFSFNKPKNLVLKPQIETVNGTSQHLKALFAIFTGAIPKRLTFGLCLYVLHLHNVHVLYCIPGSANAYYMLLV